MLPPGKGIRRAISTVAAIAVVCVVGIAGGVVYLYPSIIGVKTTTQASTTLTQSQVDYIYSNSSVYLQVSGNTSTTQTGWQEWAVANATLGYHKTQMFVRNAWNYTYRIYQSGNGSPNIFTVSDIVQVNLLNVSGNWTTGYTLTYTPHVVNVTVEYTPPSTYYPVFAFNAQNGSSFQETIQFNSTQQKAISIALANSSVKQTLSQFPYFVDDAFVFPAGNKTFGGDYLVWFFRTNGPKIVDVFVNMTLGVVVSTYADSRVLKTCYSNGVCFSSPWGYY